ncbi:adenylate/guanylate cyclase domain-containing protein [Alsobacter sp. SYSU M60028]|uniref:Adenylate/guanylate cyclase domain-containing protein n=1 Tax=Alsobacter ponti TaxID=2962936 RepID=A0ABT1LIZ0_9HYPH|nr:adenylate/guanylate cyclase domain-containing protein [Alsobacter ponti]
MADEKHHAKRRLVAILVADVAGSSRLMEADEFRAVAELRRVLDDVLMSLASQMGGRPFKKVGDGVLIEFASPVAATRCALSVQEHLAAAGDPASRSEGVRLRIGINLGDVIVDDDGDLRGDGVNVAARLEALSPVGGIAISAKVRDELHGRLAIDLIDRGEQQLKGISRPVRVFVWAPSAQPEASTPVVQPLAPDQVPSMSEYRRRGRSAQSRRYCLAVEAIEVVHPGLG